ncbi:3-oxoacyl-[acyl-carrier-protein] synthase III C-terminal domain-containing protein, partial [Phocaeicola vulgatus]|uniref:3-oxoacyl-[acyl-carrier-protein] synthase III C-terminal domain-containing protein n=1 Tax=Phocaeicola vulgatus TaxID=821 RepID=UPI0023EE809B
FLYRYPLFYILLINICYSIDNILVFVYKKLKVRSEVTPTNVTNFGNTGPATIPLLLSDLCSTNNYDLSRVVMSGFGVGLSWGSVATDLCNTHFYNPVNK